MQLSQLVRIDNSRWAGVFGGVAGATAATVVPQLSTPSSGRVALLGVLVTIVVFLLLMVVANLTGVMPKDT
jgi:hypothetical protein